jgi:hypothetical protein
MARDDSNDDAIMEGEPPFRPYSAPDVAPTNNHVLAPAIHPAMLFYVWASRVVAVLIAVWAALGAFFAYMFRFDSSDEFEMVKQVDLEYGGLLALAVVLFFVPGRIKKPVQCFLILCVAVLVWLFVSWSLLAHHEWVYRVRSGL